MPQQKGFIAGSFQYRQCALSCLVIYHGASLLVSSYMILLVSVNLSGYSISVGTIVVVVCSVKCRVHCEIFSDYCVVCNVR